MIPKILHQVWVDRENTFDKIPDVVQRNFDEMSRLNPDWEHRLYGWLEMESYVRTHAPSFFKDYHAINPEYVSARVDLFRYIALWCEGGVYMDAKSFCSRPLSSFQEAQFVQWDNWGGTDHTGWGLHDEVSQYEGGEFINGFIVVPDTYFPMMAVVEKVIHNIRSYTPEKFGVGLKGVIRTTGTVPFTQGIRAGMQIVPASTYRISRDYHNTGYVVSTYPGRFDHKRDIPNHYSKLETPVCIRK